MPALGLAFLVGSRLFVLMGSGTLIALSTFYLAQTFGLGQESAGRTLLLVLAVGVGLGGYPSLWPENRRAANPRGSRPRDLGSEIPAVTR